MVHSFITSQLLCPWSAVPTLFISITSNISVNQALHQNGKPRKDHRRNRRLVRPRKPAEPQLSSGQSLTILQGFEAIKQLLQTSQPYKVILGARNADGAREAYSSLNHDAKHDVTVLPLELSDLRGVRTFAQQALQKIGQGKIDYLFLNAAISNGADKPGPHGSKWCEPYIVNHLCKASRRDVAPGSKLIPRSTALPDPSPAGEAHRVQVADRVRLLGCRSQCARSQ